jgi:hypothetical protein
VNRSSKFIDFGRLQSNRLSNQIVGLIANVNRDSVHSLAPCFMLMIRTQEKEFPSQNEISTSLRYEMYLMGDALQFPPTHVLFLILHI